MKRLAENKLGSLWRHHGQPVRAGVVVGGDGVAKGRDNSGRGGHEVRLGDLAQTVDGGLVANVQLGEAVDDGAGDGGVLGRGSEGQEGREEDVLELHCDGD